MKKLLATSMLLALTSYPAFALDLLPPDSENAAPPKHEKMFKKADSNGDGTVTKDEFMAFYAQKFTKIDSNDDGQISKDENNAFYKAHRKDRLKKEDADN